MSRLSEAIRRSSSPAGLLAKGSGASNDGAWQRRDHRAVGLFLGDADVAQRSVNEGRVATFSGQIFSITGRSDSLVTVSKAR